MISIDKQLREIITDDVIAWTGGEYQALAWYRSQPIEQFGGLTAEDLVRLGRVDIVKAYIKQIAEGGYA